MKKAILAASLFCAFTGALFAADEAKSLKDTEAELSTQFETYKRDAVAPIAKAYVAKLEALMKQYADNKDFTSAKRIQDQIDRTKLQYLENNPVVLAIAGEWRCKADAKLGRIFYDDGTFKCTTNGTASASGTWKRDGNAIVGCYNGKPLDMITFVDRDTLRLTTAGKAYFFERVRK